jgi:hypothetical protein
MRGTRKAPQARTTIQAPKKQNDAYVTYPDLQSALVEATSREIVPSDEAPARSVFRGPATSHQESLDRALAEQLQAEEEFDAYYDPYRNRGPSAPRRGHRQWSLGTYEQPIDISSDEDKGSSPVMSDYDHIMEEADAALAQQYQEEEHNRLQEEARSAMRECAVCGDELDLAELASLATCKHQPDICTGCFQQYLATHIGSTPWNRITCPSLDCKVVLQHHEVKQYALPQEYEK